MLKNILENIERFLNVYLIDNRVTYARKLGAKIGEDCKFNCDPKSSLGNEPWLIDIGNHVEITKGVQFLTHEGACWIARGIDKKYEKADVFGKIKIGDNVMIGVYSIIMPGITIGNNVIVAAHSVVTHDIPSNSIVGGTSKTYL